MYIHTIVIILVFGFLIYKSKPENLTTLYINSLMIIPSYAYLLNTPSISSHRFLIMMLLFVVVKKHILTKNNIVLKKSFLIYSIVLFVLGFFSSNLNLFYKIYKPFMAFFETWGILPIAYVLSQYQEQSIPRINKVILFMFLYGITSFIIKADPYAHIWIPGGNMEWYLFGERVRISSTWAHPMSYGFICATLFFMIILNKQEIFAKSFLCILCFVNIMLSGSRTVLGTFVLMIMIFIGFYFKQQRNLRIICLIAITLFIIYNIPPVNEKITQVVLGIQGESDLGGSSIDMRLFQLNNVNEVFIQSPIIGNGLDYIYTDLGLGTDKYDQDRFLGLESIVYWLMIERGIVGIIIELLMIISVVIYNIRNAKYNYVGAGISTSVLIGSYVYAIGTGAIGIWPFSMFITGFYMPKLKE